MRVLHDLVGETLGDRYRLIARLAGGGMGEVYRGHDLLLDRPVAIKVLQPSLSADPEFVERFKAEARAAARLTHPNIVGVYDWGSEDETTYYMVMEYVSGSDARDLLVSRSALDPADAVSIMASVCDALDAAHTQGLVHRDVKPENILISRSGAVKVVDFGIAVMVDADRTQPGDGISGTLRYLSPEQAIGRPAGPPSDVWAAGAVLAELLTGMPPLQGAGAELLRRRAEEPPTPPSILDASISKQLDEVVMRACAVDPSERYESAGAMAGALRFSSETASTPEDLQRLLGEVTGEIVLPDLEPTSFMNRRRRGSGTRPKKKILIAAILALLLLIGGFAGARELLAPDLVNVPDLEGLSRRLAEGRAEARGLEILVAGSSHSLSIPEGDVVRQAPASGEIETGSVVKIWVSKGPPHVLLPGIVGMTVPKARAALEKAHLDVGKIRRIYSFEPVGTVISHAPQGGLVEWATRVKLVVSKGPQPIGVPDVAGLFEAKARLRLRQAGFRVVVDEAYSNDVKEGIVIATEPSAGATAPEGSELTIVVSMGPRFERFRMPDVRNMSVGAARERLENLGLRVRVVESCGGGTTVAETDPTAGTMVKETDRVALFVC